MSGNSSLQIKTYWLDSDASLEMPESPLQYLGHDERHLQHHNENNIGYTQIGDFRDVLLVPPLSNITVNAPLK